MNKVMPDTVARTVILFLALFNQVLAIFGQGAIEIAEDEIYQLVSLIATVVAALAAWWKNNSFTDAAIKADVMMKAEKQK